MPIGGCWPEEAAGGRFEHPVWLDGEPVWLSLIGPKVEAGTKIRRAVSY